MEKTDFSMEELQEMETLAVRGGFSATPMSQPKCTNAAPGCGYGIEQVECVNTVTGCGMAPVIVQQCK